MLNIAPIQTRYRGILFRSRLEARWAVYFDGIGIPWEYEPEGYDVDGTWYLPDFKLGGGSEIFYAEVKGDPRGLNIDLLAAFADAVGPVMPLGSIPKVVNGMDMAWRLLCGSTELEQHNCHYSLASWEAKDRLWCVVPRDDIYPGAIAVGRWLTAASAEDSARDDLHAKAAEKALAERFERRRQ